MDYKWGQGGLQVGAAQGISNWCKKITNRVKEIPNRGKRDYKLDQRFQIRAGITNRCRTRLTYLTRQRIF